MFLLGCYLIIKGRHSVHDVFKCFSWIDDSLVECYRDATFSIPDFRLTLSDCWGSWARGVHVGWVSERRNFSNQWGMIDVDHYNRLDDPINADLHIIVPQKYVAFRGPRELGAGCSYRDRANGFRDFSPLHYVELFKQLNVSDVVRLNEPQYDSAVFETAGIKCHDLEFPDCTAPSNGIVRAFMQISDTATGMVAVHCKAGLGRTGTLIALALMRKHGFTAREAMGWLRIMRPGSVIGSQQHFLCSVEKNLLSMRSARLLGTASASSSSMNDSTKSDHSTGRCQ